MIAIKYIGHREFYRDGACGSGLTFERGGVALVPPDIADKMLRHPSVWVRHDAPAPSNAATYVAPVVDKEVEKENQAQDLRDAITAMDKAALKTYVKTNWGQDVDGRLSVESMRQKAVELFDMYGAP